MCVLCPYFVETRREITMCSFKLIIVLTLCVPNLASPLNYISSLPIAKDFDPLPFNARIVGGEEADIKDHPYQVSFLVDNSKFCGGFIVSENYILTAAHCALDVDPSTVVLRAGSSWRKKGTVIPIAEVIPHPQYNERPFDKDVAVMKTAQPIQFTETIQPVMLAKKYRLLLDYSGVMVSGWGRRQFGENPVPEHLMHVVIPVVPYWQCYTAYYTVMTRNMWCAGNFLLGKEGTCQGDSGGAAVQGGEAVGIVSFGRGCGLAFNPTVFTDIAAPPIRDWITEQTGL